jgi:hypothetical protein
MVSNDEQFTIPEDLRVSDLIIEKLTRPLEKMGFLVQPHVVSNRRGLTRRYSQARLGNHLICLIELPSNLLQSGRFWRNAAPLSVIVETLREIPSELLIFSEAEFICQEALHHAKDLERVHDIRLQYLTKIEIDEILRSDDDENLVSLNMILSHPKKHAVFLSYSMREENTLILSLLVDFMTELGLEVYYAPKSLKTDSPPGSQIAGLIKASVTVIALLTRDEPIGNGKWRVRPNVIEETGEGALKHPIVLAEENVEVPSNIETRQTYVPFSRDNLPKMMIDLLAALKKECLV